MSAMCVKNLLPDLLAALRQRAAVRGLSMSAYIRTLIERDLAMSRQHEWFALLSRREAITTQDVAATLDEVRDLRERDLTANA